MSTLYDGLAEQFDAVNPITSLYWREPATEDALQEARLWTLSPATLAHTSHLLARPLSDRRHIRASQNVALAKHLANLSSIPIPQEAAKRFHFGSIDLLVTHNKRFVPLEFNGSGMMGLSNLPTFVARDVLKNLADAGHAQLQEAPNSLMLVPYGGKPQFAHLDAPPLITERLLYAQTLADAFNKARPLPIWALGNGQNQSITAPGIVVGHANALLPRLEMTEEAVLLDGVPVGLMLHDLSAAQLGNLPGVRLINDIGALTSDKAAFYAHLHQQFANHPVIQPAAYASCPNAEALLETVTTWLAAGQACVIKPYACGYGLGIDFFDTPLAEADLKQRLQASSDAVTHCFGAEAQPWPYTVMAHVDGRLLNAPHPLAGHRFELRLVVYRNGESLHAVPGIAKIAPQPAEANTYAAWLNTISTDKAENTDETDYMIALCQEQHLPWLGLTTEDLEQLCSWATQCVARALTNNPVHLNLPRVFTDYKPETRMSY